MMIPQSLKCRRCGGTNFNHEDENLHAVCVRCGMESQDTLNATFDDWQEEKALYERNGGGLYKRTLRKGAKRAKKERFPTLPDTPSVSEYLAALGEVASACGRAARERCDVDVASEVESTWSALSRLEESEELLECVRMETILGVLYYACRRRSVGATCCDVERWAQLGLVPWLGGWCALRQETREKFAGRSDFFRPRSVPLTSTIALLAEVRMAILLQQPLEPVDGAVVASKLALRLGFVEETVSKRAKKLAEIVNAQSESAALCCVLLACDRYHDLDGWSYGQTSSPVAEVPWNSQQAASFPRYLREEFAHFTEFCSSLVDMDFDPAEAPAGAATKRFADEVDRLAARHRDHDDNGHFLVVKDTPLFLIGPRSKLLAASAVGIGSDRVSLDKLVSMASKYLLCPPTVVAQELDSLVEKLDNIARHQPHLLASEHKIYMRQLIT